MALKETVSVILCNPPCKDVNSRFTTVPLKPYSDKNVEDTIVFLTRKVFISVSFSIAFCMQEMRNHLRRETTNENEKNKKTLISSS